jgi:hypothetical protein
MIRATESDNTLGKWWGILFVELFCSLAYFQHLEWAWHVVLNIHWVNEREKGVVVCRQIFNNWCFGHSVGRYSVYVISFTFQLNIIQCSYVLYLL